MKIKHIIGIIAVIAIAAAGFFYFKNPASAIQKFATEKTDQKIRVIAGPKKYGDTVTANQDKQQARFCPQPGEVIKKDLKWATPDNRWESYTPSSAKKILNFVGAQWVGIKVGKIICLYQTDEAVSFPVALEQTRSKLVTEPRSDGWSALVNNRRYCKSANTADCPYFIERPKDTSNVYEEIKYAPKTED